MRHLKPFFQNYTQILGGIGMGAAPVGIGLYQLSILLSDKAEDNIDENLPYYVGILGVAIYALGSVVPVTRYIAEQCSTESPGVTVTSTEEVTSPMLEDDHLGSMSTNDTKDDTKEEIREEDEEGEGMQEKGEGSDIEEGNTSGTTQEITSTTQTLFPQPSNDATPAPEQTQGRSLFEKCFGNG